MNWLILVLGIVSNASASALIKVAVTPQDDHSRHFDIFAILTNWPLFLGIFLYGVAFVLYALALSKFPLNIAHPILTSGSIALVAIVSVFLFGEEMTFINIIGIILIMLGVVALVN